MNNKLIFIHDNNILGGDTVYLANLLCAFSQEEYILIYAGSKSVRDYISKNLPNHNNHIEFIPYDKEFCFNFIRNNISLKIIRTFLFRFIYWIVTPLLNIFLNHRIKKLISMLKLSNTNKMVINSGGFLPTPTNRYFIKNAPCSVYYIQHNHVPERLIQRKRFLLYFCNMVDFWIVGSKVIKKQLVENCITAENKIKFIRYGIHADIIEKIDKTKIRKKIGVKKNEFLVLHASVFERRKGHDFTIKGFEDFQISYPESKLIIAGNEGDYLKEVKLLIKKLNLGNKVIFTGFYSPLEELIKTVDVICQPSQSEETTPFVVLMALACGTPIITTDRDDFENILRHEYNSLLVPLNNHTMITQNLFKLKEIKGLTSRLSKNGEKTFHSEFSLKKMQNLTKDFLLSKF